MSQNQSGNAKVKVGLVEFEAPAAQFITILDTLAIRLDALVLANNKLSQSQVQQATTAATAAVSTTPTLTVPATLQTV